MTVLNQILKFKKETNRAILKSQTIEMIIVLYFEVNQLIYI